jgi:hypothetical protein
VYYVACISLNIGCIKKFEIQLIHLKELQVLCHVAKFCVVNLSDFKWMIPLCDITNYTHIYIVSAKLYYIMIAPEFKKSEDNIVQKRKSGKQNISFLASQSHTKTLMSK